MPADPAIDPISSLRHRSYLIFLIGSVVSNVGNQMRVVAVGWEVYDRTESKLSLALVGLTLALPVILFALPAGAAADRYARRAIIIIAQLGLAASGLGLAWASAGERPLHWTYLFLLGTATFRALGWPASTAIVKGLVPDRVFPNAAMWRSVAFQLAATLGPLLGGLLMAKYATATVYLLDALSSLVLVGSLLLIRPAPQTRSVEPNSWRSVVQGIRFLNRHPIILSTMVLDMVAVLFGGVTALLPVYAKEVLYVGEVEFGWLRAMPSVGAILMSLLLAWRPPFRRAGMALLCAVTVFGLATLVFAVSRSLALSLGALFVLGAADNISVVIRATVLQLMTPDAMRGRVSAVSVVFIGTSNELGEVESGVAAHYLGTVRSVLFGGSMTLLTVAWVAGRWPALVRLGSLDELTPPEPAESGVSS
ncbi:MAG TPA: MFS transporter [Lacipirellulaceae bacterium]|nr:MFS transporter [Lacipirellulaceae bacterium]